jgi:hypothetical protein
MRSNRKPANQVSSDTREQKLARVKEKERKAVEIATKIAVEIHGSALKELEKH